MQYPSSVQENVFLHAYTTYKIGGPARFFAEPHSIDEIIELQHWAQQLDIPVFVLGKGSNLVVSDQGFAGLILYLGPKNFGKIEIEDTKIRCQAGALLHSVVTQSVRSGLKGMENLGGIPGTMGGGAYINAGAFDQELVQVITKVKSLDSKGELIERQGVECGFSYRHSHFFDWQEIILEVECTLSPSDPQELQEQMMTILTKRKTKQPLEYPNAGSMYKRPPGTFAGKLIEEANLKGFQKGGAQISPKHANFVINVAEASAQDIYDLSMEVIDQVEKNSGIRMEREQIFLGPFAPWPRS